MKILITGATGLVGRALVRALSEEGHTVCRLVRPETKAEGGTPGAFDVAWNPATGELGGAAVDAEAVVNLGGSPIAEGRWTPARKSLLRSSRVDATRSLLAALGKINAKPAVLVSASAIGFYGNRGDEILTEASAPGSGFLAEIAKDWEREALRAEALGTRVVLARIGVILAREGGALPKMMLPFRLGLGGRIGTGRQWVSWVALRDVLGLLSLALADRGLRGPLNVTAPEPVRNARFAAELGKSMRRPAFLPAPAPALRLVMGEMADALLLASQRVLPEAAGRAGYRFRDPTLAAALESLEVV
jgi:uncharacterized protein (TIGR01777 family)